MVKKNLSTIILIITTIILAFIALLTAIKMRQPGPIAPTVPQKKPKAVEKPPVSQECQTTFRVLIGPTLTPGPSPTITPTLTPGPTATPTPYITDCYTQCESDLNCSHSLVCREDPYRPGQGIKVCLNPDCPSERDCYCPGPTSTPVPPTGTPIPQPTTTPVLYISPTTPPGATLTPIPTATPTPITIPPVGIVENTFLAVLAGLSFLTIALLFAF